MIRSGPRRVGGAGGGLLLLVLLAMLFPSAGVAGTVTTLNPIADAYVNQAAPKTNYGTAVKLSVGASPSSTWSFLKFNVPALAGSVSKATLRLYVNRRSSTGFHVRSAGNSWTESTINWNNQTSHSATITGSTGALTAGTWTSVDVTPLVTGSGVVTFALTGVASPADLLGSRESAHPPQLVVSVNDPPAPKLTLAQPADGAAVSSSTPSFGGVAGAALGDSETVSVKVYAGSSATGMPVQTLTAMRQADNSYSVNASSALGDGTYTAQAAQQDAAGNTGLSSANTFTVDTTAPSTADDVPNTWQGHAWSVTLTASDAQSGVASTKYKVYSGSTVPAKTDSGWLTYDSQNKPSLNNGEAIAYYSTDGVGNEEGVQHSNAAMVDTTAPKLTLAQPADGAAVSSSTPSFGGVAGAALGDSETVSVKVYAGSSATGMPVQTLTAMRQADNSYSVNASSALGDGTYTAQAAQQDAAGNTGLSSANTFTVSTGPPPASGYFTDTAPVGSWQSLPSDSVCAQRVHRSNWEPRPENAQQNHTMPGSGAMAASFASRPRDNGGSYNSLWDSWLLPRVDGQFTGTTDEILQWAACKWGLPDDLLRADAAEESSWFQYLHFPNSATAGGGGGGNCYWTRGCGDVFPNATADSTIYCNSIAAQGVLSGEAHDYQKDPLTSVGNYPYTPGPGLCPQTFSILGIKSWESPAWLVPYPPYPGNQNGTFPFTRDSTAAAADYWGASIRGCYEGWETWLKTTGTRTYATGDLWGCVGSWYSGDWHSAAADSYISLVQNMENTTIWLQPAFDDSKQQYQCDPVYGCPQ